MIIPLYFFIGTVVDCSNQDLTSIPVNLPSYTTELDLSNNDLTVVPPRAFSALPQLQKLDLARNQIRKIEENAFYSNRLLREL